VRTVTGADTSAGMLEALRHKVRERKLDNVDTVLLPPGTALSLPGRYHLVVSSMALHHVAELAPLFRSFHAHLHPGGQVGLADLDREDGSFHSDRNLAQHPGFERREIELLLGDAGFVEVEVATATVTRKNERDYPIFLATGRRPG
jgi:tRNA (cmo5U34)-methyltransferase